MYNVDNVYYRVVEGATFHAQKSDRKMFYIIKFRMYSIIQNFRMM